MRLDSDPDENYHDASTTLIAENLNSTYQRRPRPKTKSTFTISDVNNGTIRLNNTFQRKQQRQHGDYIENDKTVLQNRDFNSTFDSQKTLVREDKPIEGVKRLLNRRQASPSMDLNRMVTDNKLDSGFNSDKRNSFGSSESPENLDYMSLSSGSSKSNKILSLEGINAIVEMQERSNFFYLFCIFHFSK